MKQTFTQNFSFSARLGQEELIVENDKLRLLELDRHQQELIINSCLVTSRPKLDSCGLYEKQEP